MAWPQVAEMAALADRVAPALLDSAARGAVVLALSGLAALAMRRASAAARHWVWVVGFAGVLGLPMLLWALPGWRVLPEWGESDASEFSPQVIDAAAFRAVETPGLTLEIGEPVTAVADDQPVATGEVVAAEPLARESAAAEPTTPAGPAEPISVAHEPRLAPMPWTLWFVLIWLSGSLLVLGHLFLGFLSLRWLERHCTRVEGGEWSSLLAKLQRQMGVSRQVRLLSSPRRAMPMAWGLWQARLLIPEQAMNWPAEQRRAVLLHELGHVKRRDCLTQLLARLACAIYWFNPLAWIASQRMQVERERACDDLVLNGGAQASTYAGHLLESAMALPAVRFAGAAVAMARASTLEARLRTILDPGRNRRTLTTFGALATALLLAAVVVPVAALRAQSRGAAGAEPSANANQAPGDAPAAPGDDAACTFDATIYDVRLPLEFVGVLDREALARAPSAEAFEKALAVMGKIRPLYRANQSVRLAGDTITIEQSTPFVTGSTLARRGEGAVNTVSYRNTGATFSLAGKAGRNGSVELDLTIRVSSMVEGNVALTEAIKAPAIHVSNMSYKGVVQDKRPFVAVSIDADSLDADGKAVAYIARVTVGTQP